MKALCISKISRLSAPLVLDNTAWRCSMKIVRQSLSHQVPGTWCSRDEVSEKIIQYVYKLPSLLILDVVCCIN